MLNIGTVPTKNSRNSNRDHHHYVVVYRPFVAWNIAVVLFATGRVEGKQLVKSRFARSEHVAALTEHPQKEKNQEEGFKNRQKSIVFIELARVSLKIET